MSPDGAIEVQQQSIYGGLEGPNSEYVKLISSDDFEFCLKREYAFVSETIVAMLSGPGQFEENEENRIYFREIPSYILEYVCRYFAFKKRYTNSINAVPEFSIQPEISFDLMLAANFLDC
nr:expressed protein [Hymenolepis microstoma]